MTEGWARAEFAGVVEEFDRQLAAQHEGGAAFAAYVDGECVVDLWGGEAAPGRPWDERTLSLAFSSTKGISAVLAATLIERDLLDPSAPVAQYWPEFTSVSPVLSVRELCEHKSGLAALRHDLSLTELLDHEELIAELLAQGPLWTPGQGYAYHAITFGTLLDELVRRVSGQRISQLLGEVFTEPLGLDAWIGLPEAEQSRVAQLSSFGPLEPGHPEPGSAEDLSMRSLSFGTALPQTEPLAPNTGFNDPRLHRAELPGVNLMTSARALAEMWSAVVAPTKGVRVLRDETVEFMLESRIDGPPVWWDGPNTWPQRGFGVMLETPWREPTLGPGTLGHDGLGGQSGRGNLPGRSSFAYLTNYLVPGDASHDRWYAIVAELRATLAR